MGHWGGGRFTGRRSQRHSPFPWWAFWSGFAPTLGIQRGRCGREGNPFHPPLPAQLEAPSHSRRPLHTPMRRGLPLREFEMRRCPPTEVKVETRGPSGACRGGGVMGGGTRSIAPFPFPAPQSFPPPTECGGDSPGWPTAEWKGTPPPASLLCVGALVLLSSISSTSPPPPH